MLAKWLVLGLLVVTFGLILFRKIPIYIVSLCAAVVVLVAGIIPPLEAATKSVSWSVLAIYAGYGMLATALRESGMPSYLASLILSRLRKEKYALLFLCTLAAVLSSFMANPVVVLMLAPLAIEMADRLESSHFLYLVGLAISSNVVTTMSMVADPPALILAMSTGMGFLDFYWFQGKLGLGTITVVGVAAALGTLLFQFRRLDKPVNLTRGNVRMTWGPTILLVLSVLALSIPPSSSYPAIVGLALGLASLVFLRGKVRESLKEVDWGSLLFLIGIFILIDSVDRVGLLKDFAIWLTGIGLVEPALLLTVVTWLSVLLSSFIDNVPYTVLMIPACSYLALAAGMSPFPLYFGMLVGTGIGGNITPVGATANVLACGMLEKRGYKIRFGEYLKLSVPFSVVAVAATQVVLMIVWL